MPPKKTIQISPEELNKMMRDTMRQEFETLGLFTADASERQQAQLDNAFVRRMREAFDGAAATIGKAVLGAIVVAVLGFIVVGAKLGLVMK